MSTSHVMRAIVAATALAMVPAIAAAQAATKPCKDGTTSTKSTFACWGHGGVDTAHVAERAHTATAKQHAPEVEQAGTPRAKHAKAAAHKASKATGHKTSKTTVHHAKAEHHETHVAKKKQDEGHHWLPWHHKKAKEPEPKKKKHKSSSHAPLTERPNGQPRQN